MADKEIVRVWLFNDFIVEYQGQKYDLTKYLTKQLINLFELLIIQHQNEVTKKMMYDILWKGSDNPRSALKFSIFRLRNDLKQIPHFGEIDWVVTGKNGYQMNQDYEYQLDIDEFAKYSQKLIHLSSLDARDYKLALKALKLYTGKLFLTPSNLEWFIEMSQKYRKSFSMIVVKTCQYLIDQGLYEEMIELDYQAIIKEPFYEGLHYYYMKGLIETKKYHKALQYYDQINQAFYNELGTGISDKFKELYNVVKDQENHDELLSMDDIYHYLSQDMKVQGGFYCTYDLFKYVYEVNLKSAKREKRNYYLMLIEMEHHQSIEKHAMMISKLKEVIGSSLRSSDVFAKVSDSQFILLLCCQHENNTQLIMQRIKEDFYKYFSKRQCILKDEVKNVV